MTHLTLDLNIVVEVGLGPRKYERLKKLNEHELSLVDGQDGQRDAVPR